MGNTSLLKCQNQFGRQFPKKEDSHLTTYKYFEVKFIELKKHLFKLFSKNAVIINLVTTLPDKSYQKAKSDFTHLQGDPDKQWHWHWHSPWCVSTGSPRLWELASIFWPHLSSKILPSRGEHGKRGYSVWVVGTNVFFSFQECKRPINLQKTVYIT